jgi:hypothetical protein
MSRLLDLSHRAVDMRRNRIEANRDGFNVCIVCMSWQNSAKALTRGIVRTQGWFIVLSGLESIF